LEIRRKFKIWRLRKDISWSGIKRRLKRVYYKLRFDIEIGCTGKSMLPDLGRGKYVSVYRKGDYIDIIEESSKNFVRLIPYQPNHGIMIEKWQGSNMCWRYHLGYDQFCKDEIYYSNVESLCRRNNSG